MNLFGIRIQLTNEGLFVGRAGVGLEGLVFIAILVVILAFTESWWTPFAALVIIPVVLLMSWLQLKSDESLGLTTCPHCKGSGKVQEKN